MAESAEQEKIQPSSSRWKQFGKMWADSFAGWSWRDGLLQLTALALILYPTIWIQLLQTNFPELTVNHQTWRLICIDAGAAMILLALPRILSMTGCALLALLNLTVISYMLNIGGGVPTLGEVWLNMGLCASLSGDLLHYLDLRIVGGLLLTTSIVLVCRFFIRNSLGGLFHPLGALFLIVFNIWACLEVPVSHLSIRYEIEQAQAGIYPRTMGNSQRVRGVLMTGVCEILSGRVRDLQGGMIAPLAPDEPVRFLPDLPQIPERIAILQVECLGDELISLRDHGQAVMPFLNALKEKSVYLRLSGMKKLVSANSDFEIMFARDASKERLEYLNPNLPWKSNLIARLAAKGFRTEIYHGYKGEYMNMRSAYEKMGFQSEFFREEYEKRGFRVRDCWDGVITDPDLFVLPTRQPPQAPCLQFIVTLSMHLLAAAPEVKPFGTTRDGLFYALCHETDQAIQSYYQSLPEGTLFIVYGDHAPYFGKPSGKIPFLVNWKGHEFAYDGSSRSDGLTRSHASRYLHRILRLSAED